MRTETWIIIGCFIELIGLGLVTLSAKVNYKKNYKAVNALMIGGIVLIIIAIIIVVTTVELIRNGVR